MEGAMVSETTAESSSLVAPMEKKMGVMETGWSLYGDPISPVMETSWSLYGDPISPVPEARKIILRIGA